jgi:aldose 1-epimerase
VSVHFSLSDGNKLNISYSATTDKKTIVNLTNHSYFNLSGFESPTIHNHLLKVYAGKYTVKDQHNIPTGQIEDVLNTPYDFTKPKLIGRDIDLLKKDMGYDINYVLDNAHAALGLAADLYEPESGRLMKVFTDQPGMQLYTANWWNGSILDPKNRPYLKHGAVALETQAFPDSPNHFHFPDTVLSPGQVYHSKTIYQFLTV